MRGTTIFEPPSLGSECPNCGQHNVTGRDGMQRCGYYRETRRSGRISSVFRCGWFRWCPIRMDSDGTVRP